ncbi:hypothetical protein GGQ87_001689 [Brevundimonas alba]|uniref:Peptidase C-terminal archaeal/bacterial domain-containing protein n=1 Tax=Brevundimonas alba TaxID=74314 RepID=A0A7X5YLL8_9CAUL|nr:hypothetical protein [Brevundimonas alba]NJC41431.1 hypothetical protein [Brevundimonas alba]
MKLVQLGVFAVSVVMAGAGAADAQSALTPGGTLRGQLATSDARLGDDSFYDCLSLQTRPGQRYRVEMRSAAFDAYMALGSGAKCVWSSSESDDDSAGGTDARIEFTGDGGLWSVRANSLSAGQTGAYTVTVQELGGAPMPPVATSGASIAFGQTVRGALAAGDSVAEDDSFYDCFTFTGRAGQRAVVEMRSADFDTYLSLYSGGSCAGDGLGTDDDGAGGTDSRIDLTLPREGAYTIRANSLGGGETGAYQLSLLIGGGSSSPAPAPVQSSRFANQASTGACIYQRGSRALRSMRGKTDGTDSVVIMEGREVALADIGATQAVGLPWFRDNQPVRINGRTYMKYGLPRVLSFQEVEFFAEHDGVGFAAETGVANPEVLYAVVRSVGCEFQPYALQN